MNVEDNLQDRLKAYLLRRRDSMAERSLQRELRTLDEAERYDILTRLMDLNPPSVLRFAFSCLNRPHYFEGLLIEGLEKGDASSVKFWLMCAVPKLGARRSLQIVTEQVTHNPDGVCKALYFLPGLLDQHKMLTQEHITRIRELRAQVCPPDLRFGSS